MKSINFSCVEKLQSLLDKSCSQTIRRGWKEEHSFTDYDGETEEGYCRDCEGSYLSYSEQKNIGLCDKPAKFEVGERLKLFWKKTSKYENFCRVCGKAVDIKPDKNGEKGDIIINHSCSCPRIEKQCRGEHINFKKCLGEVEITRVHKIEIDKEFIERHMSDPLSILSKVEGFKSTIEMFMYFDKSYDLSTPKQFWVYEWRYL